jgi:hypothetical protein
VLTCVQVWPFQCSENAIWVLSGQTKPTAQASVLVRADTPLSCDSMPWYGHLTAAHVRPL